MLPLPSVHGPQDMIYFLKAVTNQTSFRLSSVFPKCYMIRKGWWRSKLICSPVNPCICCCIFPVDEYISLSNESFTRMQVKWLSSVCTILVAVSEDNLYSSHPVSDISPRGSWRAKVVKILDNAKNKSVVEDQRILFWFVSWQCTCCKHFWSLGIFLTPYLLKEMGKQIKVILKTKNICCQKNLCHWSHFSWHLAEFQNWDWKPFCKLVGRLSTFFLPIF